MSTNIYSIRKAVEPYRHLNLGPHGAGTSRLARQLTTMLPAMSLVEALKVTCIQRVAGLTGARTTPLPTWG
jgi:predicted ATPase with chaperone activity